MHSRVPCTNRLLEQTSCFQPVRSIDKSNWIQNASDGTALIGQLHTVLIVALRITTLFTLLQSTTNTRKNNARLCSCDLPPRSPIAHHTLACTLHGYLTTVHRASCIVHHLGTRPGVCALYVAQQEKSIQRDGDVDGVTWRHRKTKEPAPCPKQHPHRRLFKSTATVPYGHDNGPDDDSAPVLRPPPRSGRRSHGGAREDQVEHLLVWESGEAEEAVSPRPCKVSRWKNLSSRP